MLKKILHYLLLFFSALLAFFCWFSVSRAVMVENSSVWLVPILCFSLFYVSLSLSFVLVKEKFPIKIFILFGFFSSLFFVQTLVHFMIVLVAIFLMFISLYRVKKDLQMNLEIYLPKTLWVGKTFFVLAITFVISSQYYFQAKEVGLLKIPVFDVSVLLRNKFIRDMVYKTNPDFKNMEESGITVDELILENAQVGEASQAEAALLDLARNQKTILVSGLQKIEEIKKERILQSGRDQFSKMVERDLDGTEKMSDVLIEIVNKKIQNLVSPDLSNKGFSVVPVVMTAVLFFTVFSLGAFIVQFLMYLVAFIFWLMIAFKVVVIKKIPTEMEIVE